MKVNFYKYQGTGNDFVLLDNRNLKYSKLNQTQIAFLCNRRFGIGADGLILLELDADVDFKMVYYNSDGKESSMCGNGGRCIAQFAHDLGIKKTVYTFNAIDGKHEAEVLPDSVKLKMIDVNEVQAVNIDDYYTHTGSPHYIRFAQGVMGHDLISTARAIRYSEMYKEQGVNVNIVDVTEPNTLLMRTYERGVEDETFSCGTGVTAAALAAHAANKVGENRIKVLTKGGTLSVSFTYTERNYTNIWLQGPATFVFKGEVEIDD